ncbi:hypothetical protein Q8A67_022110 [Cirrhinus molitorella]|uniref:Snake toxin/toxin-like domain-containing protein n=1 Tax=Cirrhinus molitorella TaxID=172907 RepID=A0AA88PF39_9TELE|nr:hypothetical protein Q8A67_022110 [Cirrhinus molitorella]
MDLRISVVLLLIFLTGGNSLKCYTCEPHKNDTCEAKVETCGDGLSKCVSITEQQSCKFMFFFLFAGTSMTLKSKMCASTCEPGTQKLPTGGTVTVHCCDTDLCNAADGVYKGSFLLLLSPLFFYFLFQ